VALIKATKALSGKQGATKDQTIGMHIVERALSYPLYQIAENAGREGAVVVDEVKKSIDVNVGYDASTDTMCDMIKAGIVDPKKVTRSALQNAISIAGMFLTTEAVISEIPKKEEEKGGGGGMGGMGMDDMY
jgi:chaperonin GroEL